MPLVIAAVGAGSQSLVLIAFAIEIFFDVSKENLRISSGIGVMLLLLGIGLGLAAVGIAKGVHMARGPVMVAQLISLGLSWNLLKNESDLPGVTVIGVAVALVATIVIVALVTPSARAALADRPVD